MSRVPLANEFATFIRLYSLGRSRHIVGNLISRLILLSGLQSQLIKGRGIALLLFDFLAVVVQRLGNGLGLANLGNVKFMPLQLGKILLIERRNLFHLVRQKQIDELPQKLSLEFFQSARTQS